jgi:hypothetical protein
MARPMMGQAQHNKHKRGAKLTAFSRTPVAPFSSALGKEFISGVSRPGQVSLKPSRPHRLKRFMVRGAVGAALLATWASAPAHTLTWNWSFDGSPEGSAQGTLTTAGTTAVVNTPEIITGITGTKFSPRPHPPPVRRRCRLRLESPAEAPHQNSGLNRGALRQPALPSLRMAFFAGCFLR